MLVLLFWMSFGICLYVYVGYPLMIFLVGLASKPKTLRQDYEPKVSIIIAAHNEEKHIREKIENTLSLIYARKKLEVIVASDGSTDRTAAIAREYVDRGVVVLDFKVNRGKTAVQNDGVKRSTGEIIIFMDAASMSNPQALKRMVRHFDDPRIGCVAGRIEYVNKEQNMVGASQGLYWKYEQMLKKFESRLGALVGVDGPLYAVRREAYTELSDDMVSDLVTPLVAREKGWKVVLEPDAVALEETTKESLNEFATRRRIVVRSMLVIQNFLRPSHLLKNPFLSFQLFSHKLLRWNIGLFAIFMFVSCIFLYQRPFYLVLALGQTAFYFLALLGYMAAGQKIKVFLLIVPYYFVLVNAAAFSGIVAFLNGERIITWQPSRE